MHKSLEVKQYLVKPNMDQVERSSYLRKSTPRSVMIYMHMYILYIYMMNKSDLSLDIL